jgi:hypothetical protein
MTMQPRRWLSGAGVALASAAIYSIALGFFLALMLLVISMEEGGDNLSSLAIPLSEAIILLSQGVGFEAGSITLTIMPLLLTVLLIALIRSLTMRFATPSYQAYVAGAVVWAFVNLVFAQGVSVELLDPIWRICLKTLAVFTLGFVLAVAPGSRGLQRLTALARSKVSAPLRGTVALGLKIGGLFIALFLVMGLLTAIIWAWRGNAAMGRLFNLTGMQTGSRIFSVICSLAWLPNIGIWAISWLFGGGFAIGDLATFTLWSGQASGLPALATFAMLPEPIAHATVRNMLVSIPLVCGLAVGIAVLVLRQGFAIRFIGGHRDVKGSGVTDDSAAVASIAARGAAKEDIKADKGAAMSDWRHAAARFVYAAGGLSVASVVISLGMTLLFALSNGSLGRQRLSHIGVDVVASTQRVGQPSVSGLFIAWLASLIVVSAAFAIRLVRARHHAVLVLPWQKAGSSEGLGTEERLVSHSGVGRSVSSACGGGAEDERAGDEISRRVISSKATPKEDHDDDNISTDTAGSGFRLP